MNVKETTVIIIEPKLKISKRYRKDCGMRGGTAILILNQSRQWASRGISI